MLVARLLGPLCWQGASNNGAILLSNHDTASGGPGRTYVFRTAVSKRLPLRITVPLSSVVSAALIFNVPERVRLS